MFKFEGVVLDDLFKIWTDLKKNGQAKVEKFSMNNAKFWKKEKKFDKDGAYLRRWKDLAKF